MPVFFQFLGICFFYTHNKKRGILWLIKSKLMVCRFVKQHRWKSESITNRSVLVFVWRIYKDI